jgi:hypothetical protein
MHGLLPVELIEFMIPYINSTEDLGEFQKISITAYIAVMCILGEHTHVTSRIPSSGLIVYLHYTYEQLIRDMNSIMVDFSDFMETTLYMIPNDTSIYKIELYWKIGYKISITRVFHKIVIFEHPSNPITTLSLYLYDPREGRDQSRRDGGYENPLINELVIRYLPKCEIVGEHFCRETYLKKLDLRGLCRVARIGNWFLYFTKYLDVLDLSPMRSLEYIGGLVLSGSRVGCIKIENIHRLQEISHQFGTDAKLDTVIINNCTNLKRIADNFLSNSRALSFIFNGVPAITHIGKYFMSNNAHLKAFSFPKMPHLQYIGEDCLNECVELETIDFSNMADSRTPCMIDSRFAINCMNLREVNLSGFRTLTYLGDTFLFNSINLTTLNLTKLPSLNTIRMHIAKANPYGKNLKIYVDDPLDENNPIVEQLTRAGLEQYLCAPSGFQE